MTIQEFLEMLDESGLIITDWEIIKDYLWNEGIAIFDTITITTSSGVIVVE